MSWVKQVSMALGIASMIGVISLIMFGVTTFLFAFSGGQVRMVPVVREAAFVASGVSFLLSAMVWLLRSPRAAAITAALGTLAVWLVTVFVESRLYLVLGPGA